MNENDIVTASQMMNRFFENIDVNSVQKGNSISRAWDSIIEKIYGYGKKLVGHSKVIDYKNGILLIETDHPGWNQILQANKAFILKGLKMAVKDTDIKTLAFRVKGNPAVLSEDYETAKKREQEEYLARVEKDEKLLEEKGFKNEKSEEEVPEEVKKLFKGILN